MRNVFIGAVIAAGLVMGTLVLAQPMSQHNQTRLAEDLRKQTVRGCTFPTGGWTIVDCSNVAAASSAQLNAWSRYIIQCGDDSYWAPGTAATGQDADANDGWIPQGSWVELITTDNDRYYSCLNKNSDSDCRHIECE